MNSVFKKIIMRTVIEVLWARQEPVLRRELFSAVKGRLGLREFSDRDATDAINTLLDLQSVELGDSEERSPNDVYFRLPVLEQLGALSSDDLAKRLNNLAGAAEWGMIQMAAVTLSEVIVSVRAKVNDSPSAPTGCSTPCSILRSSAITHSTQ
jgi:hypothetical protein